MKNFFFLSAFLIICHTIVFSQGCLPEGIIFETQEQIDNFQANFPGCSEIEGDVFIGSPDGNLNIMNLQGLNSIVQINGSLDIIGCYSIGDLSGLNSLIQVGESVEINSCTELDNLSGLNSLTHVGGGFKITLNNILTNIEALESLTSIGGDLYLVNNVTLHSFDGLDNLISVTGLIHISHNVNLTDITAIINIDPNSIQGYIAIIGNFNLSNCSVQSICGFIENPNGLAFISNNDIGCNNMAEVEAGCLTSVNDNINSKEFTLSPNPATNYLIISVQGGLPIEEVIIYNRLGQKVLETKPVNNTLDVSMLNTGVYLIEGKTKDFIVRQKLIKQ
jgi:hypothetical protein